MSRCGSVPRAARELTKCKLVNFQFGAAAPLVDSAQPVQSGSGEVLASPRAEPSAHTNRALHRCVAMASRDLNAARQAYCDADLEASRAAHTATAAQEQHGGCGTRAQHDSHDFGARWLTFVERLRSAGSDYLKSIVFGGLDGIITTFAVVATVAGANLDVGIVILMGFSNLFADGISMGFGDYVSSKAEIDFALREQRREQWCVAGGGGGEATRSALTPVDRELENFPEGEEQEMVELYTNRGMSESDATAVIKTFAKYPKLFVDLMMYQELNLIPPDDSASPMKSGALPAAVAMAAAHMRTLARALRLGHLPVLRLVWLHSHLGLRHFRGSGPRQCQPHVPCVLHHVWRDHVPAGCCQGAFPLVSARWRPCPAHPARNAQAQFTRQSKWKSGLVMLVNGAIAASAAYLVGWSLDHLITRKPCA